MSNGLPVRVEVSQGSEVGVVKGRDLHSPNPELNLYPRTNVP